RTYPNLPGWSGLPWSLLLVPGWRELVGRPLPEVVAAQWEITTRILLDDLDALPPERCLVARYDAFIADPAAEVSRLSGALGLDWDRSFDGGLPLSRYTVTDPAPGKWHRHEELIHRVLPDLQATLGRAARFAGVGQWSDRERHLGITQARARPERRVPGAPLTSGISGRADAGRRSMSPAASRLRSARPLGYLTSCAPGNVRLRPSPCTVETQSITMPRARCALAGSKCTSRPLACATMSWAPAGASWKPALWSGPISRCKATPCAFEVPWRIASAAASVMVISGGVRSGAATPNSVCSSPLPYIWLMMSAPPTSSPPTYSWGMVGHSPYSLMPSRISGSSSTLTVW